MIFFRHAQEVGASPNDFLRPTSTEKAGFPVAQSRFFSPEPPEAFAQPAIIQAGAKKVNANTDPRLQKADFRNTGEAQEAIKTWNSKRDTKEDRIKLTKDAGGYKNLGDLELELASRNLSFADIKAFHNKHTVVSPHVSVPRKVKGARFQNLTNATSGATDL